MRIPYLLMVLGLFAFISCSPGNEAGQAEATTLRTEKAGADNTSCTSTSYQIYRKTVAMWHQSWLWAHQTNDLAETVIYTFSHHKLEMLKDMFPQTSGVRMYYALREGDDSPLIAMVNLLGCSDQFGSEGKSVLLSDAHGGHFISSDSAAVLTANWQSFSCTQRPYYTPVHAYNYNWDIIDYIQGLGMNEAQELHVSFGLRSISPGDEWFDPQGVTHKGSIVYVNILQGSTLLDDAEHDFDFTMPCPQYCDDESPLLHSCHN